MIVPRSCTGAVLAILVAGLGCKPSPSAEQKRPSVTGPNVLLITLDTTRADRLGCYGHQGARTPTLDSLAKTGVLFDQAFCQVPLTLPSHTSLLTGTYPPTHGVHVNGVAKVSDEIHMLAESFQQNGYRTGACVGAWVLNSTFGLARGFDFYDDNLPNEESGGTLIPERTADRVSDAAISWLSSQGDDPFFLWAHFFDPHEPYAPPPEFREQPSDPYDGEIAFMDSQIRRLIDWLENQNCREQTLIVIVGDHGEAFDEHGEITHGLFVYNTTVRVPLILSFPGRLPAARVVEEEARLVDVMPTLLEIMKWRLPQTVQGKSLLGSIEAESKQSRPVYAETDYPRVGFGWASLRSFKSGKWKYIDAPQPELYDVAIDPGEMTNRISIHPDHALRLKDELDRFVADLDRYDPQSVTSDPNATKALQSLGYLGSAMTDEDPALDQSRRDPKDMAHVVRALANVHTLMRQHRYPEVATILEPLVAASPESDELHAVLGEAYLKTGRFKAAEEACRASLRTMPSDPQKLLRLGDALYRQRRIEEASTCYEAIVDSFPDYALAHNRLGSICMQRKQYAEAREHLQRCLEIHPNSSNAMVNLAGLLSRTGQKEQAVALLEKAISSNKEYAPAHRSLWRIHVDSREPGKAIASLRTACAALPNDVAMKRDLAWLLLRVPATKGREAGKEVLSLARQCVEMDPGNPESHQVLSRALVATGDVENAIQASRQALSLARAQGKNKLAQQISEHLRAIEAQPTP